MLKWIMNAIRQYRWLELKLLLIPFAILLIEMIQLLLARLVHNGILQSTSALSSKNFPTIQGLIPVLGLIVLLVVVNFVFSIFFPKADQFLLPLVGLLSGIGVLMATRLGPSLIPNPDPSLGTKQLIWVIVGFFVLLATLFVLREMRWLSSYKYTWALLGILLVGYTFVDALVHRGASSGPVHDEIRLTSTFSFQPSEFLKIFIVIFFAAYLSQNLDLVAASKSGRRGFQLPPFRQLGPLVAMLVLSLGLFVRELGLALLIYGIFLCMIYLATNKYSYVIVSLAAFALLAFIGYHIGYVQQRFEAFTFDVVNWQNWTQSEQTFAQNGGLQIVQGIIALSSGGILGAGLGLGHPTFVPVSQSDMILTAMGEELGLAGLFAIIGIYLLLIYRGYRIAVQASNPFNQLLAAGLTSIFAIQSLLIMAGNMKLLPLTGIPLPFLSYGGSSIIANYIIIGILLRISHNTARERAGLP